MARKGETVSTNKNTIWLLVQQCAQELTTNRHPPFARRDIIQCVQRTHPHYAKDSIDPIIQGLTDNLKGGAYSAGWKRTLHSVARGRFVLYQSSETQAPPPIHRAEHGVATFCEPPCSAKQPIGTIHIEGKSVITPEPSIKKHEAPETCLHDAVVAETRQLLTSLGATFILIEHFGLDIGVFIRRDGKDYTRFIEAKAWVGSRTSGVGFGGPKGQGPQVDLLVHTTKELSIVDTSVLWVLGCGTRPEGSPRYAVFPSTAAKNAAMGSISRGGQNNLRVSDFQSQLITWPQLSEALHHFLQ